MKKTCISQGWFFRGLGQPEYVPVDLPHDYTITLPRRPDAAGGACNGFFPDGAGRYVKYMDAPDAAHVILDVDGAYMCADVMLNKDQLAVHPHGYTPFLVDLSGRMIPHDNKLVITTRGMQPSTRWYSGAGLYRDVFLWTGGSVRVEPWDLFITTSSIGENTAEILAAFDVASDLDADAEIRAEVLTACGCPVTSGSISFRAAASGKTRAEMPLTVASPRLWDTEDPYLYTLRAEIIVGGEVTDTVEMTFGIRTVSADAVNGFLLNGKSVKLRGGCIHHDHGVLGAAAFPAAEERKLTRLKEAGFNAVRIAHNPPSLALLEVCDRIGMLVMDEAFDMWNRQKTDADYHLYFGDWWARDIASMVLRDRSHPCVVSYSIGNEILERDCNSDGAIWAERLAAEVRRYDDTRLVTSAICWMWEGGDPIDPPGYQEYLDTHVMAHYVDGIDIHWLERTRAYMAPLDIVGYNYLFERYTGDHEAVPDRVIWGSETHTVNFYKSWKEVMDHSYVIGDFTWTAYDNLGEAGTGRSWWERDERINGFVAPYPWRSCYQGDLNLCGDRRPQSYFREAVWLGGTEPRIFTTHPEHYGEAFYGTGWHWYDVLDTWTFDDAYMGKPVKAEVYTDADEIEFILNGRRLGRTAPVEGIASMDIPYEKGTLTAIAYKNSSACGESSLTTVGTAAAVAVKAEKTTLHADRRDLAFFDITITDAEGNRVPDARCELHCVVDGGELMGIFSGDPCNEDQYGSYICHAFEGRAVAIVRTADAGRVTVTVGGPGLRSGYDAVSAE